MAFFPDSCMKKLKLWWPAGNMQLITNSPTKSLCFFYEAQIKYKDSLYLLQSIDIVSTFKPNKPSYTTGIVGLHLCNDTKKS